MRYLVSPLFAPLVLQTKVLVDAIIREDKKSKSSQAFLTKFQREGNLALNCQAGLTRDYSGKILKPIEREDGHRPPIRNNYGGEVESSDSDDDPAADIARVKRSRGPVKLAKRVALPAMRRLVEQTAGTMDPVDPDERKTAVEHARAVVKARAEAAAAEAAKKKTHRKPKKAKKVHKPPGHESEEEEEEADIAGIPNEFLSAVFDRWIVMKKDHEGPLLRCHQSFTMRRWTRMSDPVREVRALHLPLSSHYPPFLLFLRSSVGHVNVLC